MTLIPLEDPERPAPSVLSRGLSLLSAFDADDDSLSLQVLVQRTGLPKSTAFRMINELVTWGALDRTPRGGYRLGIRLFELGNRSGLRRHMIACASPVLDRLVAVTGESVYLTMLDGIDAVVLDKRSERTATRLSTTVGDRLPLHASASGKVYLSGSGADLFDRCTADGLGQITPDTIRDVTELRKEIARTRLRGYGIDIGEMTRDITAVAAPVQSTNETLVATLAICGAKNRVDPARLAEVIRMGASWLSRELSLANTVPDLASSA
ncbi:IclR family transcriptional regulator [Leucobacter celer]|uniref:IclR family transcriptional regulator n=1 Tax=Leucobacter celer TaxID=668625 RepID=UPI0006A7909D|nr:IclR family transcriptional regulator [Leucobacter celer]